ncbi:MAG: hypothetical protein M0R46_06735 [Candidatus Muirbacterium halophilum]|nr:hypothetical protein [Candidatus Muirbacterium halophilum]
MKKKNKIILEYTEFNLQRMNADTSIPGVAVDDKTLSQNAYDKHLDGIRQALSRIDSILNNVAGTSAYASLRGKLSLEQQDLQSLRVIRIVKSNNILYDVYVSFIIDDIEYWGVIKDVLSNNPDFKSEVFRDISLIQNKEWVIRTKGIIIKTVKIWLKPEPGIYKLLNDEVICYSIESGKQLKMTKGMEIEVIRSYKDKIIIKYGSNCYNLINDNYIYFNWWFEKKDSN